MIRVRVVVAAIAALVLFAWQDVLLWQRLFERNELWQFAGTYHDGWRVMRDALAVVGVALLAPRWTECIFYASTLFLFSVNGGADALYYWLDGRAVPPDFVWRCDAWHLCLVPGPLNRELFMFNLWSWLAVYAAFWIGVSTPIARLRQKQNPLSRNPRYKLTA